MQNNSVLTPLIYEKFRKNFWEDQPLHIERADSGYFSHLLSEATLVDFLQAGDATFPEVQAINAREPVPVAHYTTDKKVVCAQKLMQFHAQGATIAVSEVHKKFPALHELCVQFSKDFQMLCQANAYLSPAGNQGFHSHYDTHDVFVLQVAGRKTFRFYSAGVKLPFTEDSYAPGNKADCELLDEIDVSAGDTLYIPRGIVHDAVADEGEPSLHITLGAFPFILRDLLQEMMQVAAENNVEWRASVDLTQQSGDPKRLYKSAAGVFTEAVYAEAISRLADEVALQQTPELPALPEASVQATVLNSDKSLSLQTTISVDQSRLFGVESKDALLKLRLPGVVLSFDSPMSDAVRKIANSESIRVMDLPLQGDAQKLALCSQLLEAGAITIKNTLGNEA